MRRSSSSSPRVMLAALLPLVLLPCTAVAQGRAPGARAEGGFEELARGFAEPPWDYAPYVFWFWDVAPPDPGVVERMALRMIEAGMNPGYVHARPPIVPEFPRYPTDPDHPVARLWLTEAWFEAFDRVVAAAERHGAQVGFCDDVWWPSLRAAGRVLERHPELRARTLEWAVVEGSGELEVPASDFAVAVRRADAPGPGPLEVGPWIAHPHRPDVPHRLLLRGELELPPDRRVTRAWLRLVAGEPFEILLDGFSIGPGGVYGRPREVDVARLLDGRRHVLELRSEVGPAGPLGAAVGLRIELEEGPPVEVASGAGWSARLESAGGEPIGSWTDARPLSGEAAARAAEAVRPDTHRPARIESGSSIRLEGGEARSWRPPDGEVWRVYAFQPRAYADVDRLDLRLGPAFVEIAIEPYLARYADRLGTTLKGVFVDNEGDYGVKLAWSGDLERLYGESTGRDLRLELPLLIDRDVEGRHARTRFDWFRCVSELYSANHGAVVDRLERAGLHAVPNFWEESLTLQATHVGDAMALLRRFTLPGNDCLRMDALDPHPFAEARAVAELEGRRLMTELMGAGRWETFDPVHLKQATNAIHTWGVSHVVPHGIFLNRSLRGSGWTPDWYEQNPMFRHLDLWSRFTRRASFVNAHGRAGAEVLLLNPQESVWAVLGSAVFDPRLRVGLRHVDAQFDVEAIQIDRAYAGAIRLLSAHHVDFLVGDRAALAASRLEAGALRNGELAFRTVVLPPLVVLPRETARLLVELARGGGHVLALGELPRGSTDEGLGDPVLAGYVEELNAAPGFARIDDLEGALAGEVRGLEPSVRVLAGDGPELVQRRVVDGRVLIWLASLGERPLACILEVPGASGRAELWDCERGTIAGVGSRDGERGARLELELEPLEAIWLSFDPTREPLEGSGRALPRTRELARLDGPWRARIEPALQPEVEIMVRPPPELLRREGHPVELVPWNDWELLDPRFVGHVDYLTVLELDREQAGGRLFLDLGAVHDMAEVLIDGLPAGARLWPPHRVELTGRVRPGPNELTVRVGNLVQNAYIGTRFGFATDSGLLGPVRLLLELPPAAEDG